MKPNGAPLRATKYLIVTSSPTLMAFGPFLLTPRPASVLAEPVDDADYARHLYRHLRAADAAGLDTVLALVPDEVGIGAAVADRLRRAAHVVEGGT